MNEPYRDFWIPKFKSQYVEYLKNKYPKVNWNKKTKRNLQAIYINIRKKEPILT